MKANQVQMPGMATTEEARRASLAAMTIRCERLSAVVALLTDDLLDPHTGVSNEGWWLLDSLKSTIYWWKTKSTMEMWKGREFEAKTFDRAGDRWVRLRSEIKAAINALDPNDLAGHEHAMYCLAEYRDKGGMRSVKP